MATIRRRERVSWAGECGAVSGVWRFLTFALGQPVAATATPAASARIAKVRRMMVQCSAPCRLQHDDGSNTEQGTRNRKQGMGRRWRRGNDLRYTRPFPV